eukprot:1631793-Alexandrium_andersonii.AAC.1
MRRLPLPSHAALGRMPTAPVDSALDGAGQPLFVLAPPQDPSAAATRQLGSVQLDDLAGADAVLRRERFDLQRHIPKPL